MGEGGTMNDELKAVLAAKSTRDRISALSDVVADAESLADAYVASEDLRMAKVHFHTPPMGVDLGKLDFFEELSPKEKDYVKRAGSSLIFRFFTEEQKKLKSISESVRRQLQKLSVGNSFYISSDSFYGDFLPYLKGKEQELEELKTGMSLYYDDELRSFGENVLGVVSKVCPDRYRTAERALAFITGKPLECFLAGISFDLETEYGPEKAKEEDRELLTRAKRAYINRQIEAIYIGQLQELFNALVTYVVAIKEAPASLEGYSVSRKVLKKKAGKVEKENIGGIPVISGITSSLTVLSNELLKDLANAAAFEVGSEIIGRGNDFGASFKFPKTLPGWFNREDLLSNYLT